MSYIKLYNPDEKELSLVVGDKAVNLPVRKIVFMEESIDGIFVKQLQAMCPAVEVMPASPEEVAASKSKPEPKPKEEPIKSKRRKKGKKIWRKKWKSFERFSW